MRYFFLFSGLTLASLASVVQKQFHGAPSYSKLIVPREAYVSWGYFAHKRINRLAVFTLPAAMTPLYKTNIEFLTAHAIDPDNRRFVNPNEGFHHYIDLDKYDYYPTDWIDALAQYTAIYLVTDKNDTLALTGHLTVKKYKRDYYFKSKTIKKLFGRDSIVVADSFYRKFIYNNILKNYYKPDWIVPADSLKNLFRKERLNLNGIKSAFAKDEITPFGVLPYHLYQMQKNLTEAFIQKDQHKILKLSAEIGHYLADAHVPLHTTLNYDGQLTHQEGIHAFWESRIPQLFADEHYDFWVGKANYIDSTRVFFWKVVRESHRLVEPTLQMEKEARQLFPSNQRFSADVKTGTGGKAQSAEYAKLYQDKLNGMVEKRMRDAILAVGSVWYTAWVDAGQPDLKNLEARPIINQKPDTLADFSDSLKSIMIGRHE